jgi:hypothetical protein
LVYIPIADIGNFKQAFLIGFIWMVLTVAFEFSLGRLSNKSWEYLFRDYNLFAGGSGCSFFFVFLCCRICFTS